MLIISSKSMLRLAVAAKCFVRQPEPRFHFISHFMLLRHKHANDDIKRTNTLRNMLMLRWMLGVKSVTFQLVVYLRVCERSEFCLFFFLPTSQFVAVLLFSSQPTFASLQFVRKCVFDLKASISIRTIFVFVRMLLIFNVLPDAYYFSIDWKFNLSESLPDFIVFNENDLRLSKANVNRSVSLQFASCLFFGSFPPKSTEYRKKRLLFIRIREKKKGAKSVQRTITRCFQSEPKVSLYSNP